MRLCVLAVVVAAVLPLTAAAQGSIFGSVQNSDLSVPPNGNISFFGFLDDTDEEIRIHTSTGAGYDNGNWFDDFQNYLTEAPGNPYDYYFFNTTRGEGFHLAKLIPNNSFQQENILLQAVAWPSQPTGLTATTVSTSSVVLSWDYVPGQTMHVYRRPATSSGSFFRIDNTSGSLADPGVADSVFVDATVDGVSSYQYILIAEDGSGNYSPHSAIATANSAAPAAPTLVSISPTSGLALGGTDVTITGSGFDAAGVTVLVGSVALTNVTVVSPYEITGTTQASTAGTADVTVTNIASGLFSNTLVDGYTYEANSPPVLATIGSQSVVEGQLLSFTASASDADGTPPVMTSSALPGSATYVDNGDGTADFAWTPGFTEAGTYDVTFYATDAVASSLVDSEQVTITVTDAGNQTPVLATIGSQTTTENVQLTFGVSSSDPDGTTPTINVLDLPTGAAFTPDGSGGGTFDWTPDFTQAGLYNVTFIATDGAAADSEVVAITVNDAGNQPPVLASIGAQSTTEGVQLNFVASASDPDGTIPTLTASPLPGTATFTDNGDGTGTFDWTPDFDDAGTYNVTFAASDGTVADSEVVAITVGDAGNQAPVLASIGAQSTTENAQLTFAVSSSDPDGTIPTVVAENLPTGATFSPDGLGGGTFDWTPDFTQAGSYDVTFIASDGVASDSEVVAITVNDAGNQVPTLANIGAQSTSEGVLLSFGVSASDPDGTIPTLTAAPLPGTATFTDNGDGTGSFDWTPSFTDAGSYNVTFVASDGAVADSEVVTISVVDAGNQAPVLASIGAQTTTENVQLTFGVTASDADGTIPTLTAESMPTGATFIDNGDGTGAFDWTPDFTQAGSYDVTFIASDGAAADSEVVAITVNDAGNQLPVLAAIGPQTTDETVNLNFGVSASDADATIPTLTTTLLPTGATFVDNGDGTGTFDWTPTYDDSGSYSVTFYASDGVAVDSEQVAITVNNVNQLPVLAAIGDQAVLEGNTLNFGVSATDGDTEIPVLSTSTLPGSATFVDNGDGTGTFDWATTVADSGVYSVTFYATDPAFATAVDSETVSITVTNQNLPPILATIGDRVSDEAVPLNIAVSASDGDGDIPILTTSALPTGATFVDNGDGSGAFDWTPTYDDSGVYQVTFFATDAAVPTAVDSEVVTITINDVNEPPVLAAIGDQTVTESTQLLFGLTATDGDGDIPILSAVGVPEGATFVDSGNGAASFDWTPTFAQAGTYPVTFYATDALDATVADSEVVTITVLDAGNQPPVLDSIGPKSVVEGGLLAFTVTASDADGTTPTLSTSTLPAGATFADSTGDFSWTPGFTQSGTYDVTFFATDGAATDSEVVTITVTESGNQPPVIDSLGELVVTEGNTLEVVITATDPEGSAVTISVNTTLRNYTFADSGNGVAVLTYNPDFFDAGTDSLIIFARDNGTPQVTRTLRTTVQTLENNQAPVIEPVGPFTVEVDGILEFTIEATDTTDQNPFNIIFLSVVNLPPNATFVDNGNNTGTFRFTPQAGQEGSLAIDFLAVDEGTPQLSSQITVNIEVLAVNQPPVLAPIGPQVLTEGETVTLNLAATDPDGTIPSFDHTKLPRGATFADNGDGTAVFSWTPDFIQDGLHSVTFKALDGIATDKENVLFQVADAGDQVPGFDTLPNPTVVEGTVDTALIYASDPDTLDVTIGIVEGTEPPNFVFADSGNGVASVIMSPDFTMAGTYIVGVWVDDGTLADTVDMIVTYDEAGNQPPVIQPRADTSIQELRNLQFTMTATDVDGDVPLMTAGNLPLGAAYTDLGGGQGFFNWTPNDTQAGVWDITFYAEDTAGVANGGVLDIDSTFVQITVSDSNRAPSVFEANFLQRDTVAEGETLIFVMKGSDPDSTIPSLRATIDTLAATDTLYRNMTFVDSADGFGYLFFTPDFTQGRGPTPQQYKVSFQAIDAVDPTKVSAYNTKTLRVYDVPQPPTIEVIGGTDPITLNEGDNWIANVILTDVDGVVDSGALVNPPPNAFANYVGNNGDSLIYSWSFAPDFSQAGTYTITFEAVDPLGLTSTVSIDFTVVDAGNLAPTIVNEPPTTKGAYIGLDNEVMVQAEDREGDSIIYSTSALAPNMALTDDGNGTAMLTFTPDSAQIGASYDVTITASDGAASSSVTISYSVGVFMRGDSDNDQAYTLNDVLVIATYLYRGGELPDPWERCDVDRSGSVDVSDLAYLVNYLYNSGPRPPQ